MGHPYPWDCFDDTSYPYSQNNCVTDEGRWPISGMRFLWDVFDNHNDADGDSYSANQ